MLISYFIAEILLELWTYSLASDVTAHCNAWAMKVQIGGQLFAAFNAHKGELPELLESGVPLLLTWHTRLWSTSLGCTSGSSRIGLHFHFHGMSQCEMHKFADSQPLRAKVSRTELVEVLGGQ